MLTFLIGLAILITGIDPILRWYLWQRAVQAGNYLRDAWRNR